MTKDQKVMSEKKEDFKVASLIVQNIVESQKIDRFKFTAKEQTALLFVLDLLSAHIKELENF